MSYDVCFLEKMYIPLKVMNAFRIMISNPNLYAPNMPFSPAGIPGAPAEKYQAINVNAIEAAQRIGMILSFTTLLVKIPKKNIPINGPYVKPANFISKPMADSLVV